MKWFESRIMWGGLLILGGVMFLLQNLDILPLGDLFWAVLLTLAGVFFLSIFTQNRANYWALVPGGTLISLAISIFLKGLLPQFDAVWSGAIVLAGVGFSFLAVFLFEKVNWWALIPMGVMMTLASVSVFELYLPNFETGSVFFLGLGITFGMVALLSGEQDGLRWAWIPAVSLVAVGLLFMATRQNVINVIWPLILIILGGSLLRRALRSRQRLA